MEVGAAESERADPRTAHAALGRRPLAQFGVDPERDVVPVDAFVGVLEVQAGCQHLVVQAEHRLEEARGPGRALEVADVGLDRAQRDRPVRRARLAEHVGQAGQLSGIADARRRAVRLDAGGRRRVDTGAVPGALHRQPLPDGVGRRDALAATVAGTGETEQHRVDPVAVALGVRQSLEDEQRGALAHHEPVGAGVERAGARRRQRADLAELHKPGWVHVVVDAAGDRGVEVAGLQSAHRGRRRGQRGGARRVGAEIGAAEVEQVRHPAGDHVRQLTRHRVLGDLLEPGEKPGAGLGDHGVAHLVGQRRERRCGAQVAGELGELDPQVAQVLLVAADRVADDHGDTLRVHGPVWPAGVEQRRTGARHRPLLAIVQLRADRRRYRQLPRERLPGVVADPPADPGVCLVRCVGVGVVVQLRIPAFRRHVADAVAAGLDVVPERRRVRRLGHDRADADHRDRLHRGRHDDPASRP